MEQLYLSRRNLLTLLAKLDLRAAGESTGCCLIKNDTKHKTFPASTRVCVTAVEDEEYYTERSPGTHYDRPL